MLAHDHIDIDNVVISLSAVITVGYTVTNVTASESDVVARLTVAITMPSGAVPIETSFSLIVNTLDGTATGLTLNLEFDCVPIHSVTNHSLSPVKLHNNLLTHAHTFHPPVAPGDYCNLTNFSLGPFSNSVHQLRFNVSIVNDSIPEDAEMFNVSLTLDPADQARLANRVIVSLDVATIKIQDDDGNHLIIDTITPHVK